MKIIVIPQLPEDKAFLAKIEALIDPDEHHDGANLMRCALVSLLYGFGFSLRDLLLFDERHYGIYVELLGYYRARGETDGLCRLAKLAIDYLRSNPATMESFRVPTFAT